MNVGLTIQQIASEVNYFFVTQAHCRKLIYKILMYRQRRLSLQFVNFKPKKQKKKTKVEYIIFSNK